MIILYPKFNTDFYKWMVYSKYVDGYEYIYDTVKFDTRDETEVYIKNLQNESILGGK